MASSSSVNGITERTGPKISSLAMDMSLVTSVNWVGLRKSLKQDRRRPWCRPRPLTRGAALKLSEMGRAAGVGVDLRSLDEHPDRPAEHVERIAGPDHQIGVLAGFDRSQPVIDPGDPGRVDGQR